MATVQSTSALTPPHLRFPGRSRDELRVERGIGHSSQFGRLEDWKIGRLEDWKIRRLEDWKIRRLEDWKIGRLEDWKIGRLED